MKRLSVAVVALVTYALDRLDARRCRWANLTDREDT